MLSCISCDELLVSTARASLPHRSCAAARDHSRRCLPLAATPGRWTSCRSRSLACVSSLDPTTTIALSCRGARVALICTLSTTTSRRRRRRLLLTAQFHAVDFAGVSTSRRSIDSWRACALRKDATAPIVCVFAAASNTTGACSFSPSTLHQVGDDGGDFATAIAHAHGALAFWDFAAYASHAPVVMNPPGRFSLSQMLAGTPSAADPDVVRDGRLHDARRDAAYFSGHKFVGGPGAPGVLLLKRALLSEDAAPNMPGGGTVLFVLKDGTPTYIASGADKEEGGSPDSLAAARMGLALRLVASVGWETMSAREEAMADFAR